MPLAKMRSIGELSVLPVALVKRSFRFLPDQKSRSKSSLPWRSPRRLNTLPKITVQLASEVSSSPTITSCTTRLACSTRVMIEKSWFMGAVSG